MDLSTADLIALSAALIGALAGIGGIVTSVNARRQAEEAAEDALKAQQEATRLAKEVARLQALDWTDQFFAAVREWSEDVVDSIARCIHLPEIDDNAERSRRWNDAREALSALCDRGRWFFPNRYEDQFGTEKEPAYRGVRRRILGHILTAYKAIKVCPRYNDHSAQTTLVASQRGFVSEVQTVLNPRHRQDQVNAVLERFGIAERMNSAINSEN
jgi:hypothetical protein